MIASEPKQYGSESCHAYDRDGNPRHQVPYKDKKRAGEFRNTTIKDIRENGWLPSVSSILGVAAKKGLDSWMKEQVSTACYELFRSGVPSNVSLEWWNESALEIAESRMTRARDLGTEIHGAIEGYLRSYSNYEEDATPLGHYEAVKAAVDALKELGVWGQPFECEKTFASVLGYGGTVDFTSTSKLLVADFKCVDSLEKKLAYPDRCSQLCAYHIGLFEERGDIREEIINLAWPTVRLCNIFISTSEPGKYLLHEWSEEDKIQGWNLFQASFTLWKVINHYNPVQ